MKLVAFLMLLLAWPVAAGTRLTGDRIDGVPVAAALHADDLHPGRRYDFWYRVQDNAIGQAWYVPVIVVRGARDGPRLLLTAGIHGDELNGIDVIHTLARTVDPEKLAGTLVMIPGLNVPGLLNSTRGFSPSGSGGENLNRLMPGKPAGDAGAANYAWSLWQLMRPNADLAIDLHTQSRGTAYVMYAFASNAQTLAMAKLAAPDMIKLDHGVKGTVENMMVADGVPAITLELGRPETFEPVMVARAIAGIRRIMAEKDMIADEAPAESKPFIGNKIVELQASRGGFAEIVPPLGGAVAAGDLVAVIRDAFGRTLQEIRTPVAGRINTIATDPRTNPGDMLMRVLLWSDEPGCAAGC